ncbi:16S rRNA (uracil(1498)-N(3))-methyltransferase [Rhodoferax sp.]|uniref:16S rRNA (uracil(1498)-N(3))-methyltransferase n=1 Tax=Rhodoferax sp. TaxID=50421 RepID=UPI00261B8497|nr:16S rRNA (uracil(1498)-N(3))-methyltransferase [Rhodoferax sp.]MDD2918780.1 16S rRNA (uracil(1498)-N(3))-methyltransferase [Rhodoferax sp.]
MPRFYCPTPLTPGDLIDLPASAARHVQVLRLQPGDVITLFNAGPEVPGSGGEYEATITQMGRSHVQVQVGAHTLVEREAALQVHLALGMPANERMDWLVEKATELGVASIQPLMTERSVLRLSGERADKKQAHWQNVAVAACEQCGGNRVPRVHAIVTLAQWLKTPAPLDAAQHKRLLLSLRPESVGLRDAAHAKASDITFLSGPEGGLSPAEEDAALAQGFAPVTLGSRVLRSETAAIAAAAALLISG